MTLPCTPVVKIRLGTGASFANVLILGDALNGILGTNVLGTASTEFVNVSNTVQQISIRHGRDRMFEQYLPGECFFTFLDTTGDWNPANTLSPYYGKIRPMSQVQITTTYDGTDYYLFSGYVTAWDWQWADPSVDYAEVTVVCQDGFRLMSLANIDEVTGSANKDLPGERIDQILDEIGWPSTMRNIDTGTTELQKDPDGIRPALQAIQTVEQSDLGAFFIAHDGVATYYSRATMSAKAAGTAYEFDDIDVGIQYQDIDISLDETELANEVTITRVGGTPQTASDATSIGTYFLRSYARSNLMMETNAIALNKAQQILAYRKDARLRVDSITLDLSSDTDRVEPALVLEIGEPIIVRKNISGGTHLDLRVTVQGHQHDITPDRWIARYSTAYPLSTAFILGSSEFGVLGTNTL